MSSVKWSLNVIQFLGWGFFFSQWSSDTRTQLFSPLNTFGFQQNILYSKFQGASVERLFTYSFANMLTSCLNIQTLLSHKPLTCVWLALLSHFSRFYFNNDTAFSLH